MKVPTATTVESPIMIDVRKIGSVELVNLLTKNQTYDNISKKVQLNTRLGQYAKLRLTMFQPTSTPFKEKDEEEKQSAMQLLGNNRAREKFLRFTIKMQADAQLELITIPFIELPFSEMRPMVIDIHRNLLRLGLQPVFFVDLKYEEFQPLIKLLIDELQSKAVGLIYKPYRTAAVNYDLISRYHDHDVVFITANTNRYDTDFDDIATMHYLPFYGNDVYAVARPPPFHETYDSVDGGGKKRLVQPRLQSIRFFSKQNLKVKPATESNVDSILSDFENRDHEVLGPILQNRAEANGDLDKWSSLNYLSKVHELHTSLVEFGRLQQFIDKSETKQYLKEKPALKPVLTQLKPTTLNGFS
jgi:hypothetical protein